MPAAAATVPRTAASVSTSGGGGALMSSRNSSSVTSTLFSSRSRSGSTSSPHRTGSMVSRTAYRPSVAFLWMRRPAVKRWSGLCPPAGTITLSPICQRDPDRRRVGGEVDHDFALLTGREVIPCDDVSSGAVGGELHIHLDGPLPVLVVLTEWSWSSSV